VIEIEFDPDKDAVNRRKHGFGLDVALVLLEGPVLREQVVRPDLGEERWIAICGTRDVIMTVCYAMRETRYRIISVRRASRKERKRYAEAKS
jgi:uncharacterized protein